MSPSADSAEIVGRYATHDLVAGEFIARVLGRAHRAAMVVGAPDEARAILDLAESFADELATADSGFDRLAFLEAVMEDPS